MGVHQAKEELPQCSLRSELHGQVTEGKFSSVGLSSAGSGEVSSLRGRWYWGRYEVVESLESEEGGWAAGGSFLSFKDYKPHREGEHESIA